MGRIILIDNDMVDADQITRYFLSKNEELTINRLEDAASVGDYLAMRSESGLTPFEEPSMIVMDVDFPNAMNGMQIIRRIKQTEPLRNIPLFVFTNNTDKNIVANCFVMGVSGYFKKPTNHFTFNNSVKQLVDRWNALSQTGFGYNYRAV